MSVNEVKLFKAEKAFQVRGDGPQSSRVFVIGDEGHTIGNALRHVLMQNQDVSVCGYSVPHPAEPYVQIRVQCQAPFGGGEAPKALDVLKDGCRTLQDECDIALQKWEKLFPNVTEDRHRVEQAIEKFEEYDPEEEEGELEENYDEMMDTEPIIEDAAVEEDMEEEQKAQRPVKSEY